MDELELKKKRKEFLDDTWRYYDEDVSRRAIEDMPETKCGIKASCKYRTIDGKKCAIGRYIPDDMYDAHIEGYSISSDCATKYIPESILVLGNLFLMEVQSLHDCDDNWNRHGLSDQGRSIVERIEKMFGL